MRFCPWYPLAEAVTHAPPSRGVLQLRIADGLIDYPSGKSAMIHYQHADDLRVAAYALAAAHPAQPWLCRHTIEMSAREIDDSPALYAKLLRDFVARFGTAPTFPGSLPPETAR